MASKKQPAEEIAEVQQDFIEVFGAREHNLKNIDISIPKNKLVVLPVLVAVVSLPWLLTLFTMKGSAAIWKASEPTPASL